ncbi:MAG: GNAT family N-acetyltransferase [Candidatus Hodarchaeota archaeon]
MVLETLQVVEMDPLKSSQEEWRRYHAFRKKRHVEKSPEDPFPSDENVEQILKLQTQNSEFETHFFTVLREDNEIIGTLFYMIPLEGSTTFEGNMHICIFEIGILPEYRRKGIGRSLLRRAYDFGKANDRKVLVTSTDEPDGRAFLKAIGAQEALTGRESRLNMDKVDWNMVKEWAEEGLQRNLNTKLTFVYRIPEEIIDEYSRVYTETNNQQPFGDLDINAIITTPESIRKDEKDMAVLGRTWITAFTTEPDGKISGLTEINNLADRETILIQRLTGVKQEYRGRGLGKWLKAAMLLRIKEEFPKAKIIKTTNATTNAPMLSINTRMGFKLYKEGVNAQITLDKLNEYLEKHN